MHIRRYESHQFDQLVDFITRLNSQPAHHIGYFGTHPADIKATLQAITPPLDKGFLLALDNQQIVGVMGVEYDPQLGRAWLFGPLLERSVSQSVADRLYAELLPVIPTTIYEHELFCDSQNYMCQSFADQHAFPLHTEAAILTFTRNELDGVPFVTLPELSAPYIAQFSQLHAQLFPRTYASAEQIVEMRTEHTRVLVVTEQEQLLGYVLAKVDLEAGSGYTDYIGVAEHARRRGVGQQLLAAILHWMFSFDQVQQADLTVTATNTAALHLYTAAGFQHERTMRGYRKHIDSQSAPPDSAVLTG
jgi:ribosomal protein S18 acetylase RimI-like enzyme